MEFIGHINGITKRNKTNITYQSMIDGELEYEYQIHRMFKKTGSVRCAGCRSAMSDGRAPDFKPEYLSAKIDFASKTVKFNRNPDEEPHCCERRHPHWVKGKQLRLNVRNRFKETGATGTECIQALNKEVRDNEEDGDHDGVMFHVGKTETLKRQYKRFTKPVHVQNCEAANIDEDLQKSTFSDGSNIVRINDKDFVFLMEDKGIEILRISIPLSYNFNIYNFRKKLDFRICFTRYKQSLADGADDYLRSQYGEILKRRKPKYVESERKIIQRKAEMNVLYDAFVEDNNNRPEMDVLLLYSYRQAKSSTQRFDDAQPDPRFVLQDAAVPHPQQPLQQPVHQQQPNNQQAFIHPFWILLEMRQMLHQPIRPQFYQNYQNQFYQRFAPPPMHQQPPPPRINLNQSLPVNYNHQFIMQQFPPNQFYRF